MAKLSLQLDICQSRFPRWSKLVKAVHRSIKLYRKHPVRSILIFVLGWSLIATLIQIIHIVWSDPKSFYSFPKFAVFSRKIDFHFITAKRITLLYTYHDFIPHPVETDIKQHPKVIWLEQELFEPDSQNPLALHQTNTLHDFRNCTRKALTAIEKSFPFYSWLKWKKDCTYYSKAENGCYSYLKNMCLGSYIVIKTTSQVTLQYILGKFDVSGLRILHLVPMESSLPTTIISYWGKLHKVISLPFTEINDKVDFCSRIKADIKYVESHLSLSLDDKYMLLNVEDYKSNPRWYIMELLNFLDLYPSDYHLQQIHSTPTGRQEASKATVPVKTLLQVNLDGLQALKTLKNLSNC